MAHMGLSRRFVNGSHLLHYEKVNMGKPQFGLLEVLCSLAGLAIVLTWYRMTETHVAVSLVRVPTQVHDRVRDVLTSPEAINATVDQFPKTIQNAVRNQLADITADYPGDGEILSLQIRGRSPTCIDTLDKHIAHNFSDLGPGVTVVQKAITPDSSTLTRRLTAVVLAGVVLVIACFWRQLMNLAGFASGTRVGHR